LVFFPFGSIFFTDLVHYVRSGDFVQSLLDESQNLNEYAFALGALAHYDADIYGHPLGVNLAVPMVYPKDRKDLVILFRTQKTLLTTGEWNSLLMCFR